jgi:hypothetical protein
MKIFQNIYDAIKNWQPPAWVKALLSRLNDVIITILKQAGQAYIDYLKTEIIFAANHSDWSSKQKFQYVYDMAKKGFVEFGITLKDNELNTIINYFVSLLKKEGAI